MSLSPDLRRAIVSAAAITGAVYLCWRIFNGSYLDMRVYVAGAQALLDGKSLYDSVDIETTNGLLLPFTYPPFAAVLFIPFALLPTGVTLVIWTAICLASLGGICYMTALRLPALAGKAKHDWAIWEIAAVIFAVAAFAEPISDNFDVAQVNLIIVFVVMYDTVNRTKYAGFATGMAAGFKVVPGLFIILMLVTRRWADFGRAMLGFAVTLIIGSLFGVSNVWRYWASELFHTDRVGDIARLSNLSVRGITARALEGDAAVITWIVVCAAIVILGFTIAAVWWSRSRLVSATVIGLTSLLVSPISWPHHWVWLVPAVSVCAALAVRAFRSEHRPLGALLAVAVVLGALPAMVQLRFILTVIFTETWFRLWVVGTAYAIGGFLMLVALGIGSRLVGPGLQAKIDAGNEFGATAKADAPN